ncbi:EAL and GGDEF domain-containing protein [Marinobacter sediminum]|uniref:sensor domain-containing protein n=1 Tax=Marinobacter sediminum TaxID=256323 RepID=UPI00193A8631|nr:EAL domain-containing protein [Marinobacter sediminum]
MFPLHEVSAKHAYHRFILIAFISGLLPLLSLLAGGAYLYQSALQNQIGFLQDEVNNLSRVLDEFGNRAEMRRALQSLDLAPGLGKTGEILVAAETDGRLNFLVAQQFEGSLNEMTIPRNAKLAEPMQQALSGSTGWMTGLDYEGNDVLAAYAPARNGELGVVAKIDQSEFLEPYWVALSVIGLLAIPLILASSLWVVRTGKSVAAELRRKQRSLELLLGNVPGVVYRISDRPEGELVYVSDGVEAFLGVGPKEVLASNLRFWDVIEDQEQVRRDIQSQLRHDKVYDVHYRLRLPEGNLCWVRDQGRSVKSENGRYIEGFITDIDETRRALDNVVRNEQRYRAVFDNANDGIFLMDGMHFLECNSRTGELFGVSPRNLIGSSPIDLSPELQPDGASSEERAKTLLQRVDECNSLRFEWRHKKADGQQFDAEVSLSKVTIDGQKFLLAIVRDISAQKALAQESAARHAILQSIFENTTDAVFVKDQSGRYLYVNQAVSDMTGLPLDTYIGRRDRDIWDDEEIWRAIERQDKAVLDAGESSTIEEVHPNRPGRSLLTTKGVVVNESGEQIGVFGIAGDITDWKNTNQRLGFLSQALDQAEDIVFVTDAEGRLVYVNGAFERMTGYSAAEAVGQHAKLLKSGQHDAEFYQKFWRTLTRGKSFSDIFINRRKNGELFHNHQTVTPVLGSTGETQYYLAVGKDLSERLELEEKLHRASYFDLLTKGPNRQLLCEELQTAIERRESTHSVAFLTIDLHRFQRVNDSFGTEIGDQVLRESFERIRRVTRENAIVGRVGSDEFGVVLPEAGTPVELTHLAQKVQKIFLDPFDINGQQIFTRVNIGIALAPGDGDCAEDLLFSADSAMTDAKQTRPGSYRFFSSEIRNRTSRLLTIESGLREALAEGQFELSYQPKVNAQNGVTVGAEALLRWRHPIMGTVSPGEFIPVAEETGLIVEIGYWVIREACQMAARLENQGYKIPIAINLSPKQFDDPHLGQIISAELQLANIPADSLECEITESTFISNAEVFSNNIRAVRDIGVTLAIDDFGTGYSSLSYLKRLPVSVLKIDRSFITDIAQSEDDQALVRSMIAIAESLSLRIVVEGVEDKEQLAVITQLGCEIVQGFYFSRGLPERALLEWLKAPSHR